jgi:shikimate dehydrogenase
MNQVNYHFGLVGFPLGHSLSPRLHQAALNSLGLSGDYALFPIPNTGNQIPKINEILTRVRKGILNGLNFTIPYKQAVVPLMDGLTPAALAVSAVNTVFIEGDRLVGDNTDIAGFGLDLLANGLDYQAKPGNVLVLGAGGAARAVVYALASSGWNVFVAARHLPQAERLSLDIQLHLQNSAIRPLILSANEIDHYLGDLNLIVNATPLGMSPDINGSPWPVGLRLPSQGLVYDLVYNPHETTFLRQARLAGLSTCNGLGMLARQAAAAFERWTGFAPPVDAMWNVLDDFRNSS